MKELKHSIVSDNIYNDVEIYKKNKELIPRIFIHNIFLSFKDDNFPHNFTIPISNDLFQLLNILSFYILLYFYLLFFLSHILFLFLFITVLLEISIFYLILFLL